MWYKQALSWGDGMYIVGTAMVGTSAISHGRSPYAAWGVTALNPDVVDIFVESLDSEGNYRASEDQWSPIETYTEIIKVRFGSDIHFPVRYTKNGVILPNEFLDGSA